MSTKIDDVLTRHGFEPASEPNATLAMSIDEAGLLLKQISRSHTYIEWGSGGSTELVSHLITSNQVGSKFKAYSIVDHVKAWKKMHYVDEQNNTKTGILIPDLAYGTQINEYSTDNMVEIPDWLTFNNFEMPDNWKDAIFGT